MTCRQTQFPGTGWKISREPPGLCRYASKTLFALKGGRGWTERSEGSPGWLMSVFYKLE
jgi:hypothetical protein